MEILNFCYLFFVYFVYPETRNLTLEEVAKVFDGPDAKVARVDMIEMEKGPGRDKAGHEIQVIDVGEKAA